MKRPPYLGIALLALGGIFLIFLIYQFQGTNKHELNFSRICLQVGGAHFEGADSKQLSLYCDWIRQHFIADRAPLRIIRPEDIAASAMPHDRESKMVLAQDPYYFSALGFCFFSFKNRFRGVEISPKQFAAMEVSFSVVRTDLRDFVSWLDTAPGKSCSETVRRELPIRHVVNLVTESQGKAALIVLNPAGFVALGLEHETVVAQVGLKLNHERIHVLFNYCPKLNAWAKEYWQEASEVERRATARRYSQYNWQNLEIAAVENLAHSFESDPMLIDGNLGRCVF